jgi:hypothetical protein
MARPSSSVKMAGVSVQASPAAMRSSSWWARWRRNTATVSGSERDGAGAAGLRLTLVDLVARGDEPAAHSELRAVKIDIVPAEREEQLRVDGGHGGERPEIPGDVELTPELVVEFAFNFADGGAPSRASSE